MKNNNLSFKDHPFAKLFKAITVSSDKRFFNAYYEHDSGPYLYFETSQILDVYNLFGNNIEQVTLDGTSNSIVKRNALSQLNSIKQLNIYLNCQGIEQELGQIILNNSIESLCISLSAQDSSVLKHLISSLSKQNSITKLLLIKYQGYYSDLTSILINITNFKQLKTLSILHYQIDESLALPYEPKHLSSFFNILGSKEDMHIQVDNFLANYIDGLKEHKNLSLKIALTLQNEEGIKAYSTILNQNNVVYTSLVTNENTIDNFKKLITTIFLDNIPSKLQAINISTYCAIEGIEGIEVNDLSSLLLNKNNISNLCFLRLYTPKTYIYFTDNFKKVCFALNYLWDNYVKYSNGEKYTSLYDTPFKYSELFYIINAGNKVVDVLLHNSNINIAALKFFNTPDIFKKEKYIADIDEFTKTFPNTIYFDYELKSTILGFTKNALLHQKALTYIKDFVLKIKTFESHNFWSLSKIRKSGTILIDTDIGQAEKSEFIDPLKDISQDLALIEALKIIPQDIWKIISSYLNIGDIYFKNSTMDNARAFHLTDISFEELITKYGSKIDNTLIEYVEDEECPGTIKSINNAYYSQLFYDDLFMNGIDNDLDVCHIKYT